MRARSWQGLCGLGGLLVVFALPSTAQAVSAKHWVPDGYDIEHRVAGDFNHDGALDWVFVVRKHKPPLLPTTRDRRLIVTTGIRGGGGFLLSAEGRRAVLCSRCGGAFFAGRNAPVGVEAVHGTIVLTQRFGGVRLIDQKLTFAFNNHRVELVGIDESVNNRRTHEIVRTIYNLRTGERTIIKHVSGRAPQRSDVTMGLYTVVLSKVDFRDPHFYAVPEPI